MKKINCLNLCEILSGLNDCDKTYELSIQKVMENNGLASCERIYFGSNFCSQYFIHMTKSMMDSLMKLCSTNDMKLTLVIPIFTQKDLDRGKSKLNLIMKEYTTQIDEITVNDYGMLSFIHDNYDVGINLGRLFMKDYRDPRIEEYFKQEYKPKIFTKYLMELIDDFNIISLEFDPTHESIDFIDRPKASIGIHWPYAYMTVGQICEFASIDKIISKKFRPNVSCSCQCMSYKIQYDLKDDREWIRIGRTIYFNNKECNIKGLDEVRMLHFPILLEGYYENISST